ncbi:MAG: protein-L-isoaspartate O-methyltransferase [Myxococcales bacterium]|mgnify:CR=1 FL=1|nr:protein-L-isoaspartate O-methyltransferase [Myxococcales bacterium]
MIRKDLQGRDIVDTEVLRSMVAVPRQAFVPDHLQNYAYADRPLPIGYNQTISQPYIVALMTQLVQPASNKKALDIGTGSGYQAAVLAEIVDHVYGIEIVCPLADTAKQRLDQLNYTNITMKCGDGYIGWTEHAPFDIIIVAAAPEQIPQPLIDQLAPGGRLVIPVGKGVQELRVVEKTQDGKIKTWNWGGVRFVPMTGKAQD